MNRFCVSLVSVLGCIATVANADCGDDFNNLYMNGNCDFDSNASGWTHPLLGGINAVWLPALGSPNAGSVIAGTGGAIPVTVEIEGPCVMAAGDGSSVGFGAHMFDGQATGLSVSCLVYYRQYSDMACATEIGSRTDGTPVAASFSLLTEPWAVLFDTNTFDGSAQSILLGMECDIPGDAALTAQPLADNFYFGAGLTTPVDLQYFDIE